MPAVLVDDEHRALRLCRGGVQPMSSPSGPAKRISSAVPVVAVDVVEVVDPTDRPGRSGRGRRRRGVVIAARRESSGLPHDAQPQQTEAAQRLPPAEQPLGRSPCATSSTMYWWSAIAERYVWPATSGVVCAHSRCARALEALPVHADVDAFVQERDVIAHRDGVVVRLGVAPRERQAARHRRSSPTSTWPSPCRRTRSSWRSAPGAPSARPRAGSSTASGGRSRRASSSGSSRRWFSRRSPPRHVVSCASCRSS